MWGLIVLILLSSMPLCGVFLFGPADGRSWGVRWIGGHSQALRESQ